MAAGVYLEEQVIFLKVWSVLKQVGTHNIVCIAGDSLSRPFIGFKSHHLVGHTGGGFILFSEVYPDLLVLFMTGKIDLLTLISASKAGFLGHFAGYPAHGKEFSIRFYRASLEDGTVASPTSGITINDFYEY